MARCLRFLGKLLVARPNARSVEMVFVEDPIQESQQRWVGRQLDSLNSPPSPFAVCFFQLFSFRPSFFDEVFVGSFVEGITSP